MLEKISESAVLYGPLWYNSKISTHPLFEVELYKKGILSPVDVLTNTGEIMSKRNIELSYNVSLNFLNYYRLKLCLTGYLKGISFDDDHFVRPFYLSPINMLYKSKKGSQDFLYHIMFFILKKLFHHFEKWETRLTQQLIQIQGETFILIVSTLSGIMFSFGSNTELFSEYWVQIIIYLKLI